MEDVLPVEVRDFASKNLESVAQLEALLLLRREQEIEWTPAKLARRLYIIEPEGAKLLDALRSRQLIRVERGANGEFYKYGPATEELDRLVSLTAEAHAKYLIPLTHYVHTQSVTAAQKFANAFRLREKK